MKLQSPSAMQKSMYFIAILPPASVSADIRTMQEQLEAQFHAGAALRSPPHITLVPTFHMHRDEEENLEALMKTCAAALSPFDIVLDGYGHFRHSVLFIRAESSAVLSAVHANCMEIIHKTFPASAPQELRDFHPHITLAHRDLEPAHFKNARDMFTNSSFHAEFRAESLTLLKHNGKYWEVFRQYPFGAT